MRGTLAVLVAFLLCINSSLAAGGGKRAIVTLLSGPPSNAEKYVRLLHFFVYSLRNAGYDKEIVVLHTRDYPINHAKLARLLKVRLVPVEKITIPNNKKNQQYGTMLTKLHIWNLVEYQQVMYYDCDFVFQHNPEPAFDECSWSQLCATVDTGMARYDRTIEHGTYFNAGFLVIRPSRETYQSLFSQRAEAYHRAFVEQDLLNMVYKNSWGKLNQKYNLMHCYQKKTIDANIVAIHEKMWILRENFPQKTYLWNSGRLQVNYPITDVLVTIASAETSLQSFYGSKDAGHVANPQIDPAKPKRPVLTASTVKGIETNKAINEWNLRHNQTSAGSAASGNVGANKNRKPAAQKGDKHKYGKYLRQRDDWIKERASGVSLTAPFTPNAETVGASNAGRAKSDAAVVPARTGKIVLVSESNDAAGNAQAAVPVSTAVTDSSSSNSNSGNRIFLVVEQPSTSPPASVTAPTEAVLHDLQVQQLSTPYTRHRDDNSQQGASAQHSRQEYQNGVVRTTVKATGAGRAGSKRSSGKKGRAWV